MYAATLLLALLQTPEAAQQAAGSAYAALRAADYDVAISLFRRALADQPGRAAWRKDLAYTLLKVGETEAARDQFGEVMRLEPANFHAALEFAFLCHETGESARARRIFDRVRREGDADSRRTAAEAFENVDRPLREGIARWREAIARGAGDFSAHYELASLAERRDQWELAAEHYEKAWRTLPARRSVLVDLGRVLLALNRVEPGHAALLAASRGLDARSAERARELLPSRYPYVDEFRAALRLDPENHELRRELAYLLLQMSRQPEAEFEFAWLAKQVPGDLLSAAQLGFLRLSRGDSAGAMPLLERVLAGGDPELANRVRAVLRMPQVLRVRDGGQPASAEARLMAERSLKAGYLKDALKYLQAAHESDPLDFSIVLQIAQTHNNLRDDSAAVRWFDLARRGPDALVAAEAGRAVRALSPALARFRTSAWTNPIYSSRWRDLFSYSQARIELNRRAAFVRPYLSVRLVGDLRRRFDSSTPNPFLASQQLSESSVILALGLTTRPWRGAVLWGEAGHAFQYLTGAVTPDYRGGVAWFRNFGPSLLQTTGGWFAQTEADGVFVSRFGHDFLVYSRLRGGYRLPSVPAQLYWNGNLTFDARRQAWANFAEAGPGVRWRWPGLPESVWMSVDALRGTYLLRTGNVWPAWFTDVRAGAWYAWSR